MIKTGDIVTYKADDNGVYTLKAAKNTKSVSSSTSFEIKKNTSAITTGGDPATIYSNSKTVFVVKEGNDYKVYTGTTNAPSMKAASGDNQKISATWFCKSGSSVATLIFVFPE